MPDLGAVNDASSVVGERAGSGRFGALALRSYVGSYITAGLPWINVRDWGAKGDGVTDDTAAINAAYAAVPASGAVVVFPQGVYLTSAPIVVSRNNTITEGCGSEIQTTSATADHFQLGSSDGIANLTFRDLSLWATVTKTAGAGFKGVGIVNDSCWYNVRCSGLEHYGGTPTTASNLWNGYDLSAGCGRCYIDPASMILTKNHGIDVASGAELYMDGRVMFCAVGCHIGGSFGGAYFNGEFSQCGVGVLISTLITGATNREVLFEQRAIIDSCKDYALEIQAGSVAILDVNGSWFSSSGQIITGGQGVGLYIAPAASSYGNAKINGARFANNTVTGFVNAGMQCLLSGCMFNSNGAGAVLATAGANGTMIDGCSFLGNTGAGVTLQTGINDYAVTNNKFLANGTAVGGDAVGWTNVASQVIRGNSGFATRNNGAVQILAGTASVTFAHGLPGIPHGAILVSGNEANHTLAVGTVTATQITVNADTNVSADLSLFWEASMGPFA
jgi:hypothetical protein